MRFTVPGIVMSLKMQIQKSYYILFLKLQFLNCSQMKMPLIYHLEGVGK